MTTPRENTSRIFSWMLERAERDAIPLYVGLEVTSRCNLDCVQCYFVPHEEEDLSFEEIRALLPDLREAGCLFLALTGGECTSREDLPEIIAEARSLKMSAQIISNGTMIDAGLAARLARARVASVGLSVYGATAATHDRVTRQEGSFERTMAAIRHLREAGIVVRLKLLILRENVHEMGAMLEMAQAHDGPWAVDAGITARTDGRRDPIDHQITDEQFRDLFLAVPGVLDDLDCSVFEAAAPRQGSICLAGRAVGWITSVGDVWPCVQLPTSAGNLREQSFREIWRTSPVFEEIRAMRPSDLEECVGCELRATCARCMGLALLEDGDLYGCATASRRQARAVRAAATERLGI